MNPRLKTYLRGLAFVLAICVLRVVYAQTPAPVVYRLPPEASAAWTEIVATRKALLEKYRADDAQLQKQQVALLLGAGVPQGEWDRPVVTESSGVIALLPKPAASPKPTP